MLNLPAGMIIDMRIKCCPINFYFLIEARRGLRRNWFAMIS